MVPLKQIELSFPEEVSLRRRPRTTGTSNAVTDDNSETSEIFLDILAKEGECSQNTDSQSTTTLSCWNPDGSDYSLDMLLQPNADPISTSESTGHNCSVSDHSLNVKLSQQKQNAARQPLSFSQISQETNRSLDMSAITETTESPERKFRSKRKVHFFPKVRILRVPNLDQMPLSQIRRVWFSREEFKAIRNDCFETIDMMQTGEIVDEDGGYCARGLEFKTDKAYKLRQRNKFDVQQALFEEQQFQQETGIPDPELLARVSVELTRFCVRAACELAREDEEDANEYLGLNNRYY